MNIFKSCFEPVRSPQFDDNSIMYKIQSPHQRLQTSNVHILHINHQTDYIANKLEVRGAWRHNNEVVDYRDIAYKQQKYREFIKQTRKDMSKWNLCFQQLNIL